MLLDVETSGFEASLVAADANFALPVLVSAGVEGHDCVLASLLESRDKRITRNRMNLSHACLDTHWVGQAHLRSRCTPLVVQALPRSAMFTSTFKASDLANQYACRISALHSTNSAYAVLVSGAVDGSPTGRGHPRAQWDARH